MYGHETRDDAIRSLENTLDILHAENVALVKITNAAKDYYRAAQQAHAVGRANARRGGSSSAIDAINYARLQAKNAHDRLMDVIEAVEAGEPTPTPEPAPLGERPEDV